jgi:hypothetical protein
MKLSTYNGVGDSNYWGSSGRLHPDIILLNSATAEQEESGAATTVATPVVGFNF